MVQYELGEVLPTEISAEQWLKAKRQRYFFVAFLVLLITASAVVAVALHEGRLRSIAEMEHKRKEDEVRRSEEALKAKREALESRIRGVDQKIKEAVYEYNRGRMGMQFAPDDQKPLAMQIMVNASEQYNQLLEEKKKLQAELDGLR